MPPANFFISSSRSSMPFELAKRSNTSWFDFAIFCSHKNRTWTPRAAAFSIAASIASRRLPGLPLA
jgi:hypothetical protein